MLIFRYECGLANFRIRMPVRPHNTHTVTRHVFNEIVIDEQFEYTCE